MIGVMQKRHQQSASHLLNCLSGLTLKTSICLSLYDFQVLHSHSKPNTEHLQWRLVPWIDTARSSSPCHMDIPLVCTSWVHSFVWSVPKISQSWHGHLEGGWHSPHWRNNYLWSKDWRMVSQSSLCYRKQLEIFVPPHGKLFDNYRDCSKGPHLILKHVKIYSLGFGPSFL